jgi:hypothetical protein
MGRMTYGAGHDERAGLAALPERAHLICDALFCVWNVYAAGSALAERDSDLGDRVHDAPGGIDTALLVALADEVRAGRIADEQMFGLTGWHAAEWTA